MSDCGKCNGTGSLSCDIHGDIDCGACDVAVERAGFNAWARMNVPCTDLIDAWIIYQWGKSSGHQHTA